MRFWGDLTIAHFYIIINSSSFLASDRLLGFDVTKEFVLVTLPGTQGRILFLGVLATNIYFLSPLTKSVYICHEVNEVNVIIGHVGHVP